MLLQVEDYKFVKKFILFAIKAALLITAATFGYKGFFHVMWEADWGPDAFDGAYQHALLRQYNALEAEREPEVIIYGASYVPFGIDGETMKASLGQEVQILGVEASFTVTSLNDFLKNSAIPGDTIVYMLGSANIPYEGPNSDFITMSIALESDKEKLFRYWERKDWDMEHMRNILLWRKLYTMIASKPVEVVRKGLSDKEQVYDIASFDERGMMTVLREGTLIPTEITPYDTLQFDDINLQAMDELNEFKMWCDENNISFYICYSPMIEGSLITSEEGIAKYHEDVVSYMDCEVLGRPEDYFLPIEDFYNHIYHLNTNGARAYSQILADKLLEIRE